MTPIPSRPRLVALDTALLSAISRDAASRLSERREQASAFADAFGKLGIVIFLCWHHMEELIAHRDPKVIADRLAFIRSLPLVSWVAPVSSEEGIGSIVDILGFEVLAALTPNRTAGEVRDHVAFKLIKFGAGWQALRPYEGYWAILQEQAWERQERARELVAISRSKYNDMSKVKLTELERGVIRSPEDRDRQLKLLGGRLAEDIQLRGDQRIRNPAASADRFFDDVKLRAAALTPDVSNPTHEIMRLHGIEPSEMGPDATPADVGDLAAFRHRLHVMSRIVNVPFEELKFKVSKERLPSLVIQGAIDRYRQDTPERKGSDLTDNYLACLSTYADVTYVDKRTLENIRRAEQKHPELNALLRRVEKASNYQMIAGQLSSFAP
jgi:hypothetical protein